jgi:hypothetical protein
LESNLWLWPDGLWAGGLSPGELSIRLLEVIFPPPGFHYHSFIKTDIQPAGGRANLSPCGHGVDRTAENGSVILVRVKCLKISL